MVQLRTRLLLLFLFFCCSTLSAQQTSFSFPDSVHLSLTEVQDSVFVFYDTLSSNTENTKQRRPRRLVASLLCITLGPFGVHRLYLGTTPNVPVAYTLTLGGGVGILPVVDLLLIVFSNDITPYLNNPNVFMWSEGEQ
ncbi:MAG TPA: hypothetical protein DEP18_01165 [Flavobacteriales bacterium]|nr:hypothetical protein [Flavobacteriales bacterium]HCA82366.1 hypothetical protein [Flavobacteriales bacterium]HRE73591.1 TM2 domain-containing protein [Flavobacteriales bacterium]HRE95354.1 TM2 domain-containing protein [Flavobacteriales bacterium]HRJ35131.1 TM2 domain-containing protein [Flavobacteriales bacterium]